MFLCISIYIRLGHKISFVSLTRMFCVIFVSINHKLKSICYGLVNQIQFQASNRGFQIHCGFGFYSDQLDRQLTK